MTVALCLAILCLAAIAGFALWAMWGTIKALRTVVYDAGRRQDNAQARVLALSMDARGSLPMASQALDHARPIESRLNGYGAFQVPEPMDDVAGLAGG